MSNKGGAGKAAYDKAYNARPEQKKKRAERNAARREYEKKHGDQPSTVDIDHKQPLSGGGSNNMSNLRAVDETRNRGWRRGQSGYKPKKV